MLIIGKCREVFRNKVSDLFKAKSFKEFTLAKDNIERRYVKGIRNLFEIYIPISDQVLIFDNSEGKHKLIAEKSSSDELNILDEQKFNELKNYL